MIPDWTWFLGGLHAVFILRTVSVPQILTVIKTIIFWLYTAVFPSVCAPRRAALIDKSNKHISHSDSNSPVHLHKTTLGTYFTCTSCCCVVFERDLCFTFVWLRLKGLIKHFLNQGCVYHLKSVFSTTQTDLWDPSWTHIVGQHVDPYRGHVSITSGLTPLICMSYHCSINNAICLAPQQRGKSQ